MKDNRLPLVILRISVFCGISWNVVPTLCAHPLTCCERKNGEKIEISSSLYTERGQFRNHPVDLRGRGADIVSRIKE